MSATGEVRYRRMSLWRTALWFLIVPAALGSCVGLAVHGGTTPLYRATMTVRLSPGSRVPADSAAAEYLAGLMDSDTLQATNLAVLQDDKLKADMVNEQILARPPIPEHFRGMSRDAIIEEVSAAISVSKKGRTELVLISAEGTDPDLLPDLAMRLWTQFSSMQSTIRSHLMDRGLAQAKKEMKEAQKLRQAAEGRLQDHLRKSSFSLTTFGTYRDRLPEMESDLRHRQTEVETRLLLEAGVYEGIQTALEGEGDSSLLRYYDEDIVTDNEDVRKLRQGIDTLKADFAAYRRSLGVGPGDPRWRQYEKSVTKLEEDLEVLSRGLLTKFAREYRGMQKRQKALAAEQAVLTREIAKFEEVARIYDMFKTDVDVTRERYDRLAAALDEILRDMGRAMADDSTGIVFGPSTPVEPFNLDLFATVAGGTLAGLVFGPVLCLFFGLLRLMQLLAPRVKVKEPRAS